MHFNKPHVCTELNMVDHLLTRGSRFVHSATTLTWCVNLQGNKSLLNLVCCMQLVIYGTNGNLVTKENIQNPDLTGAVHNITNYLITLLAPGGPSVPISAVILAVQRDNGTAEVAAAFNAAVAAGYIPQLEALLKQASPLLLVLV